MRKVHISRSFPAAMAAGALLAGAATTSQLGLVWWVPQYGAPFLIFFPFTYWATRLAGRTGGWTCAVLSLVGLGTLVFPPPWEPPPVLLAMVAFLVACGVIIHPTARLRSEVAMTAGLLSITSHDLKAPLGAMRLRLQALRRRALGQTLDPNATAASLLAVDRQIDRMVVLINDLLDLSRIRAGRLRLDLQEADLCQVLERAIAHARHDAGPDSAAVTLECNGPLTGAWDPSRLEQVVTNLVSNALKYGEGSPVRVRAEGDVDEVRFAVCDDGPGIPAHRQRHIWEAFERGRTDGAADGSQGLGLWIVSSIVKAHGGRSHLDSAPGRGSTFQVRLPRGRARRGAFGRRGWDGFVRMVQRARGGETATGPG